MRNDTPSGQSNLTYWQVGKALYMKEDFNILAKSPEKKALLDIGKNEGEYFEPRHLIGFGDERVRMREMPSGANPKTFVLFYRRHAFIHNFCRTQKHTPARRHNYRRITRRLVCFKKYRLRAF